MRVDPPTQATRDARGFADVWWRGKFAWEYKRKDKHRDLTEAYRQLCQYREALENPPLLIVSDIARIEIHTNFTGTRKDVHVLALAELDQPENLDKLRRVFIDPKSFEPTLTAATITEAAATEFARIAQALRDRRHDPHTAAHFLMKCMFCLFAEDVGLLPEKLLTRLLERYQYQPEKLTARLTELFALMRTGGDFGTEPIAYFNGGLFDERPVAPASLPARTAGFQPATPASCGQALELRAGEIGAMLRAAQHDWGAVEPAIFGTLFERSLDPSKRAQIGAHSTSRDDIMLIVEPVIMAPLRREWQAVQAEIEKLLAQRRKAETKPAKKKADDAIAKAIEKFLDRLASIRVLDPACGSGNFLYVAIQQLLDLEKEVITFAARPDVGLGVFPRVRPTQLHGIEINAYAAELAQVVVWIGYLQWMRDNGFVPPRDPILAPLQTIECRDAILDYLPQGEGRGEGAGRNATPVPAQWPDADFIIGNPPFLGTKMLRGGLGDEYVEALFATYDGRIPGFSDLCCYWFELAREAIERKPDTRGGLLATQAIRNDAARVVLERIKRTGDIFMAWSDREWVLEGAHV
ncbi:MAG TPA: DNA methyltransferase, partial [Roseiflexaceae bacterium]